jgi:hypothetical protein
MWLACWINTNIHRQSLTCSSFRAVRLPPASLPTHPLKPSAWQGSRCPFKARPCTGARLEILPRWAPLLQIAQSLVVFPHSKLGSLSLVSRPHPRTVRFCMTLWIPHSLSTITSLCFLPRTRCASIPPGFLRSSICCVSSPCLQIIRKPTLSPEYTSRLATEAGLSSIIFRPPSSLIDVGCAFQRQPVSPTTLPLLGLLCKTAYVAEPSAYCNHNQKIKG